MEAVSQNSSKPVPVENQILVVGDALIDHQYWIDRMPRAGEDSVILSFSKNVGGSAANTAIALAFLGVPTKFYGTIGRDPDGVLIVDQMQAVGVDISGIQWGEVTGFTITMIDQTSERTMFSFRGASSNALSIDSPLLKSIKSSRVLLTSGYQLLYPDQAQVVLSIAERVKAEGNLVALDPSPLIGDVPEEIRSRMLGITDILLPNRHEIAVLTGEEDLSTALEKARHLSKCVAVKLGSRGAWMAIQEGFQFADGQRVSSDLCFQAPAKQVQAVDTTGAGDAFNAGFLASFLRDETPENWLRSGNNLAGEVVQHRGAVSLFCSPSQTSAK
jgi:sugar/nucleoside kinase (ribokinase family)